MLKNFLIKILSILLISTSCYAGKGDVASCTAFYVGNEYLVTAGHCVKAMKTIRMNKDDKEYTLSIVAVDYREDVAILKGPYNKDYFTISELIVTDVAYAIGFPIPGVLGYNLKIYHEWIIRDSLYDIYTGGTTCHGDSGGPLVADTGNVIGMIDAGFGNTLCTYYGLSKKISNIVLLALKSGVTLTSGNNETIYSKDDIYQYSFTRTFLIFGDVK